MFERLVVRLQSLFRRTRVDQELDEEMQFHLDRDIARNIARGMRDDEAYFAAHRSFGNVTGTAELARDAMRWSWLEQLGQDIRYSVRTLKRNPGFTTIAVASLALGIGANTAIFTIINALSLRTLPVNAPEELVTFRAEKATSDVWRHQFWYQQYEKFRDQTSAFSSLAAVCTLDRFGMTARDRNRESELGPTRVATVTGNYFSTLGVGAAIGRPLTAADDRVLGAHPVAVVSHRFWQQRLGGDANVLSSVLTLNGAAFSIIGVTAAGFSGDWVGRPADVWVPSRMYAQVQAEMPERLNCLRILARLKPGATISSAQPSVQAIWRQDRIDDFGPNATPEQRRQAEQARITVVPAGRGYAPQRASFGRPLTILMGVVGLVLVIACANIANLFLVRAAARGREIALRVALGADRVRLVRQLLTESVLVSALGGVVGLVIAIWSARLLATVPLAPVQVDPRAASTWVTFDVAPDARVFAFTGLLCLVSAIAFGLAPTLRGSNVSIASLLAARGAASYRGPGTRNALVVGEVALSLVLLTGAGLFVRTVQNLESVNLGVDRSRVLMVFTAPGQAGYRGASLLTLNRTVLERVARVAGVVSVTASDGGFLLGTPVGGLPSDQVVVEGLAPKPGQLTAATRVSPGYFATFGLRLLEGRDFSERDTLGAPRVSIVNETWAHFYFGNASPVGKRYHIEDSGPIEVIGVVADTKYGTLRDTPRMWTYSTYQQEGGLRNMELAVRTVGEPTAVSRAVRHELHAIDPRLPILGIESVEEHIANVLMPERLIAALSSAFGALAAIMAALGLYGVISHMVARRVSEIGIRIALGATHRGVLGMVVSDGLRLFIIGIAIGVPAALAMSRLVATTVFGVSPADPLPIVTAALLMGVVTIVASLIPAYRAARVDPIVALRTD